MIKGDSDDYNLLTKWSKGFDCKGNYSCELDRDWETDPAKGN